MKKLFTKYLSTTVLGFIALIQMSTVMYSYATDNVKLITLLIAYMAGFITVMAVNSYVDVLIEDRKKQNNF
jgi:uncharacterized membrane protein